MTLCIERRPPPHVRASSPPLRPFRRGGAVPKADSPTYWLIRVEQELQSPQVTCLLPKTGRRAWERPPYIGNWNARATYTAI